MAEIIFLGLIIIVFYFIGSVIGMAAAQARAKRKYIKSDRKS